MGAIMRLETFVRRLASGSWSERDARTIAEACIEDMTENAVPREILDSHMAVLDARLRGIEDYLHASIPNLDDRVSNIFYRVTAVQIAILLVVVAALAPPPYLTAFFGGG